MDTTAPTIRARDHEVAELRADKAELLEGLRHIFDQSIDARGPNALVRMIECGFLAAALIRKHGA
jgi:hypothetical protein